MQMIPKQTVRHMSIKLLSEAPMYSKDMPQDGPSSISPNIVRLTHARREPNMRLYLPKHYRCGQVEDDIGDEVDDKRSVKVIALEVQVSSQIEDLRVGDVDSDRCVQRSLTLSFYWRLTCLGTIAGIETIVPVGSRGQFSKAAFCTILLLRHEKRRCPSARTPLYDLQYSLSRPSSRPCTGMQGSSRY